jgi:hypothetical protein
LRDPRRGGSAVSVINFYDLNHTLAQPDERKEKKKRKRRRRKG